MLELDIVLGQPGVEVFEEGLVVCFTRGHERAQCVERRWPW
jgi:hypothetical protein